MLKTLFHALEQIVMAFSRQKLAYAPVKIQRNR